MSSFWNNRITFSIFGESHGPAIGIVIDNLPPGEYIDKDKLLHFMSRRAPKKDGTTTPRGEKDLPQIMSGVLNERTTGAPLCAMIQNTDTRSKDYSNLSRLPRPGHADYTGAVRYQGFNDVLQVRSAVRYSKDEVSIQVLISRLYMVSRMICSIQLMFQKLICLMFVKKIFRL